MSKAVIFFAQGLEECEALLCVDILRRAGVEAVNLLKCFERSDHPGGTQDSAAAEHEPPPLAGFRGHDGLSPSVSGG